MVCMETGEQPLPDSCTRELGSREEVAKGRGKHRLGGDLEMKSVAFCKKQKREKN